MRDKAIKLPKPISMWKKIHIDEPFGMVKRMLRITRAIKQLRKMASGDRANPKAPSIIDPDAWEEKCRHILLTPVSSAVFANTQTVIEAFYQDPIECLKEFNNAVPDNEVVLLVTVKNNNSRIEHFLKHYRKLGVRYFVFIDNGSTDGTTKTIMSHKDTACYHAKAKFNSWHKAGWFSRMAAHYGADRWYVVVESDELLVYPGMSTLPIQQFTQILTRKGYMCVKTIMLDVYPNGFLMDGNKSDEEYLESCEYFDRCDTAMLYDGSSLSNLNMRARVFSLMLTLTKFGLIQFNRTFLIGAHKLFPVNKVANALPYGAVQLHYKFLPSDRETYKEIAEKEGTYWNNSSVYKRINSKLLEAPQINPMCDLSVKFNPETAWQYLPFIVNLAEGIENINRKD